MFSNKRILITGGTGSLGKTLVRRLLSGEQGKPQKIIVFSRDEAKQHEMRMAYKNRLYATDEIIYRNFEEILEFYIGAIRDKHSVASVLKDIDIIFNAAALKQVPTCEYFPYEAVMTNICGAENIVRVIRENHLPIEAVVGVSTDKACKPINVMGMTKSVQERIFINANLACSKARFICVRYGNVLASRGSVIPLFIDQIRHGGPITITTQDMTRFLITLDNAVDTIFAAVREALPGETYIPKIPSARIVDIADVMIGNRKIEKVITGIRPGEKIHEVLVSEEECHRTVDRGSYYVIQPILPELLTSNIVKTYLSGEFSSADNVMNRKELEVFLEKEDLLEPSFIQEKEELLR